jgi:ubiquitin-conjugating enzyme E2 O
VRVCESRMDFLRAVIIGPQGTPYHDGLFFFDCFFPPNYPAVPPVCIINVRRVLRCALCCV